MNEVTLPQEIWVRVFNFLPVRDLGEASLVCQAWAAMTNSTDWWAEQGARWGISAPEKGSRVWRAAILNLKFRPFLDSVAPNSIPAFLKTPSHVILSDCSYLLGLQEQGVACYSFESGRAELAWEIPALTGFSRFTACSAVRQDDERFSLMLGDEAGRIAQAFSSGERPLEGHNLWSVFREPRVNGAIGEIHLDRGYYAAVREGGGEVAFGRIETSGFVRNGRLEDAFFRDFMGWIGPVAEEELLCRCSNSSWSNQLWYGAYDQGRFYTHQWLKSDASSWQDKTGSPPFVRDSALDPSGKWLFLLQGYSVWDVGNSVSLRDATSGDVVAELDVPESSVRSSLVCTLQLENAPAALLHFDGKLYVIAYSKEGKDAPTLSYHILGIEAQAVYPHAPLQGTVFVIDQQGTARLVRISKRGEAKLLGTTSREIAESEVHVVTKDGLWIGGQRLQRESQKRSTANWRRILALGLGTSLLSFWVVHKAAGNLGQTARIGMKLATQLPALGAIAAFVWRSRGPTLVRH